MLPLGLHFGLPEDEYRADPGLGYTDHKKILGNAVQWQARRMTGLMADLGFEEPKEGDDETVGKRFGKMLHTLLLDGRAAFDARYSTKPEPPEPLLGNKQAIKAALVEAGVDCFIPAGALLHEYELNAKLSGLGHRLPSAWEAECLQLMEGKEEISRRWAATFYAIDRMMDMARADHGGQSLRQRFLTGGYPEVSVIWEDETGLRLKARFDYLRIKGIVELKKYMAKDDQEPMDAFTAAVQTYAYDMQAMHYRDARAQLPAAIETDGVHVHSGLVPAGAWLTQLGAQPVEAVKWAWLTFQTAGLPEIDAVEPPLDGSVFTAARGQVLVARQRYRHYAGLFGEDQLWTAQRGIILLDDQSFKPWIMERGTERWTTL